MTENEISTDLGTFLYEIANKINKEGNALRSLGKTWFGDEGEEYLVIRQFGIDICDMGNQLLDLRKQLCKTCKMKSVSVTLNFEDSTDQGK